MRHLVSTKPRLPAFAALRAFEAAARHLSFREAGDELCVTHSAISHQVKELERELGGPLFWRKGRRVELTDAGTTLFPVLRDAFARIGDTTAYLRQRSGAAELTLQVYVTVASRWLLSRLHRFEAANPQLRLRLSTSHRGWDFDAENVDVGMIYREPPFEPELTYWPLFHARLVPVASPALVQGGVGLRQPAELVNHRLLSVYTAQQDWALWLDAVGIGEPGPPSQPAVRQLPPGPGSSDRRPGRGAGAGFRRRDRPARRARGAAISRRRGATRRLVSRLPQGADARSLDHPAAQLADGRDRLGPGAFVGRGAPG